MIVVGGIYDAKFSLLYSIISTTTPNLNQKQKKCIFLPKFVRRAHLAGPPHCYQSSNTKNSWSTNF